jgi:putative photosynthetic complex assembly protein
MGEAIHQTFIPKGSLVAAAALIAFALTAVTLSRVSGVGATHMVLPAAVESRDLQFEDGKNGAVLVYDARDRHLVDTIAPGSNGFVRVVLRGLARERRLNDVGPQPPFRLTRFENGQMTLQDMATSRQVDLVAFGSTNSQAFARLLDKREN